MTNPTTMLTFIQRILQSSSSSSRKRKRRNTAFTTEHATSSEIEDLRNTITEDEHEHEFEEYADGDDREKNIAAFLALGEGDPAAKRVKQGQSGDEPKKKNGKADGRLSTISEKMEEEEQQQQQEMYEHANGGEKTHESTGDDDEMVDVDLGLHAQTGQRRASSDGTFTSVMVDQDLWTWTGASIVQR